MVHIDIIKIVDIFNMNFHNEYMQYYVPYPDEIEGNAEYVPGLRVFKYEQLRMIRFNKFLDYCDIYI